MEDTPDEVEIVLEPYPGQSRAEVINTIQKELVSSEVELNVEQTVAIGAIAIGIGVKFASEIAWRAYLHGVEPRLKQFAHFISVKYFQKGKEIPMPKEEKKPEAPNA